ncbi:MAG: TlpA family protein disulfide reductase [Ectothiorhodospiraceae bacterium]|nr:TlpA family protein disulfide reductase [Ectothiorhodospiraceae bacterium]
MFNVKGFAKRLGVVVAASMLLGSIAQAEILEGPAPDFTLKSRSGENVKLSELRGDVVMINFWASWCAPCRQEMPLLEDMYKKYSDLGFVLLGVNVEEDSSKAIELLREVPVSFPVLFDNKNDVTKLYKVVAMPSTVMVDRDGNMRYLHRGYLPGYEAEYIKQIKELIRE